MLRCVMFSMFCFPTQNDTKCDQNVFPMSWSCLAFSITLYQTLFKHGFYIVLLQAGHGLPGQSLKCLESTSGLFGCTFDCCLLCPAQNHTNWLTSGFFWRTMSPAVHEFRRAQILALQFPPRLYHWPWSGSWMDPKTDLWVHFDGLQAEPKMTKHEQHPHSFWTGLHCFCLAHTHGCPEGLQTPAYWPLGKQTGVHHHPTSPASSSASTARTCRPPGMNATGKQLSSQTGQFPAKLLGSKGWLKDQQWALCLESSLAFFQMQLVCCKNAVTNARSSHRLAFNTAKMQFHALLLVCSWHKGDIDWPFNTVHAKLCCHLDDWRQVTSLRKWLTHFSSLPSPSHFSAMSRSVQ